MTARRRNFGSLLALFAGCILLFAGDTNAQQPARQRPGPPRGPQAQRPVLRLFERLSKLPPEERLRALETDPEFLRLPPQRQQAIRERLGWLNLLPPDEQRVMLERMQRFENLSPEERLLLRQRAARFQGLAPAQRQRAQRIFRLWRQLPPERQQLVRERVLRLRDLPPLQRRRLLNDPEFLGPLTPREIRVLRGLVNLAPLLSAPGLGE